MFSGHIAKQILFTGIIMGLLSSCTYFQRDFSQEPNHSWLSDKDYYDRGSKEAGLATVAYSQGNFDEAEKHLIKSLASNPRQPQALLVGALLYEQLGRANRARQYYEDLIVLNGPETSLLGTDNDLPEKMSEIAKKRLRMLNVRQSKLIIEDIDGTKTFNIGLNAADKLGKSAMEEALFVKYQAQASKKASENQTDLKAAEILFSPQEQNIISRFLILKELAENDLITKEEFLSRRTANIGGLLPLTHKPAALGTDAPVPTPDMILERIAVLKDAVESRSITPREFSAERDLIIEALLSPNPRKRMKNKVPSKDILSAAKDIRKLEILYDLNLITTNEKIAEKKEIEKYLGINKTQPSKVAKVTPVEVAKLPEIKKEKAPEVKTETPKEISQNTNNKAEKEKLVDSIKTTLSEPLPEISSQKEVPQTLVPNVSSPFE